MSKTIILISSILLATAGCTTQEVIEAVSDTAVNILPSGKNKDQQSQTSGKDIEDASCAEIRYEKRTTCRIQVHLNILGYKVGYADGLAGRNTESGIKKFQSKHNINPVDGKPSFKLLNRLREENTSGTNPLLTGAVSAAACATGAALMEKDPALWAMICGAGGVILQGMSNTGKKEYAMRYYEIKDENERTENEINKVVKQTQENKDRTRSYQSEIKNLIANEKNDRLFISKANKLRDQLDEQARKNKQEKTRAEIKIAILDDQINDVNILLAEKPSEDDFMKTLFSLESKKTTLIDAVNQSNGIARELTAQKSMLDNEIVERS